MDDKNSNSSSSSLKSKSTQWYSIFFLLLWRVSSKITQFFPSVLLSFHSFIFWLVFFVHVLVENRGRKGLPAVDSAAPGHGPPWLWWPLKPYPHFFAPPLTSLLSFLSHQKPETGWSHSMASLSSSVDYPPFHKDQVPSPSPKIWLW